MASIGKMKISGKLALLMVVFAAIPLGVVMPIILNKLEEMKQGVVKEQALLAGSTS
jgi:hypothetical protein